MPSQQSPAALAKLIGSLALRLIVGLGFLRWLVYWVIEGDAADAVFALVILSLLVAWFFVSARSAVEYADSQRERSRGIASGVQVNREREGRSAERGDSDSKAKP